jgi:hypothetical protein
MKDKDLVGLGKPFITTGNIFVGLPEETEGEAQAALERMMK